MNRKQRDTLKKIFEEPPPQKFKWEDIVDLLTELVNEAEGDIRQGNGARTRVELTGSMGKRRGVFVPPYDPYASIGLIRAVRAFLDEVGVTP